MKALLKWVVIQTAVIWRGRMMETFSDLPQLIARLNVIIEMHWFQSTLTKNKKIFNVIPNISVKVYGSLKRKTINSTPYQKLIKFLTVTEDINIYSVFLSLTLHRYRIKWFIFLTTPHHSKQALYIVSLRTYHMIKQSGYMNKWDGIFPAPWFGLYCFILQ